MAYHTFKTPEGEAYGSFRVYRVLHTTPRVSAGWYWVAEFPGCIPDGEPNGPYPTEKQAIAGAGLP